MGSQGQNEKDVAFSEASAFQLLLHVADSCSNIRVKGKLRLVKVGASGEPDLGLRSLDPTQCLGDPDKRSIKSESRVG